MKVFKPLSIISALLLANSTYLIGENLKVEVTRQSNWDSGFCAEVSIYNPNSNRELWNISFDAGGLINNLWNANYNQNLSTLQTTASGVDWNRYIEPNSNRIFGYCATKVKTSTTPNLAVNPIVPKKLFSKFNIGFGGAYAYPFTSNSGNDKIWVSSVDLVLDNNIENNSYYSNIKNFDATAFDNLQNSLKHSKFLVYWLVKGWDESWFNITKIQKAIDAGYIPVFNYWYFGDRLDGIPTAQEQSEYTQDNAKVAKFLSKLKGTKLLIMEPEFNKQVIVSSEDRQHKFASIIGSAIDNIKSKTDNILFSLAMMDTGSRGENSTYAKCGFDNCSLGDKYEWGKPSIVYNDLSNKLDFISFQEMVAQFSRNPNNPGDWNNPNPIAYNNADIGIDNLSTRIANFSEYLHKKYKKPVFLPYIAIATATWSDTNSNGSIENSEIDYNGWEDKANSVYQELSNMKTELLNKGLFGFAPMALFDDPQHDVGGYQFFMQNEYHLGIIKSSAVDGVDIAPNGDITPKSNIINSLFN